MVRTEFDLYINKELRLQVDRNNIMEKGYETIIFDNNSGEIDIEIHVHNYLRVVEGITRPIKFGGCSVVLKHSLFSFVYEWPLSFR